jgi:hypothetical protein
MPKKLHNQESTFFSLSRVFYGTRQTFLKKKKRKPQALRHHHCSPPPRHRGCHLRIPSSRRRGRSRIVPCSPPLPSPHRRRHRHHHHQPPLVDRWTDIVRWREIGRGREGERERVGVCGGLSWRRAHRRVDAAREAVASEHGD